MTKQITISLPDKHFETFMGLFKQYKIKVEMPIHKTINLSQAQKAILDQRLKQYKDAPNDVTEWDAFMKELENEI